MGSSGKKKKKPLVTITALRSHMSIFLGLSSALDHPLNLSDWLEFSPAVGKEQRLRPEYVYLANEPRKENAVVLRQQHGPLGRCRESENLFSIWMLCTYMWLMSWGWDRCHSFISNKLTVRSDQLCFARPRTHFLWSPHIWPPCPLIFHLLKNWSWIVTCCYDLYFGCGNLINAWGF